MIELQIQMIVNGTYTLQCPAWLHGVNIFNQKHCHTTKCHLCCPQTGGASTRKYCSSMCVTCLCERVCVCVSCNSKLSGMMDNRCWTGNNICTKLNVTNSVFPKFPNKSKTSPKEEHWLLEGTAESQQDKPP